MLHLCNISFHLQQFYKKLQQTHQRFNFFIPYFEIITIKIKPVFMIIRLNSDDLNSTIHLTYFNKQDFDFLPTEVRILKYGDVTNWFSISLD